VWGSSLILVVSTKVARTEGLTVQTGCPLTGPREASSSLELLHVAS
jgi:hypothetical protein